MAVEEKAEKTHGEDGFLANPLPGRRNRGMWGGGNVPPTFGTSGVQGGTGGGPMKMIFASTAVFIQYYTRD